MDMKNHHLHKPVFIGEVKADGQFNVVWKTPGPVKAKPWSPVHRRQRQEEGRAGRQVQAVSGRSVIPGHAGMSMPLDGICPVGSVLPTLQVPS
jgi:hypothetical protein